MGRILNAVTLDGTSRRDILASKAGIGGSQMFNRSEKLEAWA